MEQTGSYKVSVVTAVYNVEDYLEEMIESIMAQTIGFEYIQLILVDDGSKDSSGQICDRYAAKYPDNIVVLHKENGGVSSARNEGLKRVKGEYVNFTDADDMLEENALELMYAYLKENEEKIDLVAIRLKLFGKSVKDHPLNFKFEKTKLVDLEKEYSFVQLAMNSTLIKRECFDNRCFDVELSYAEDTQVLTDILLDKMQYGVVSETSYLYRKRDSGDSAIDSGRSKVGYYVPYMEKFILYSLENSLRKKGYIPQFVQYLCMYDLQWRLQQDSLVAKGVLTDEDKKKYKELILKALFFIDNKIIVEQKNIGNNYKCAILLLKEENVDKKEIIFCPNDIKIRIKGCFTSAGAGAYTGQYQFISVSKDKIIIEGFVRYFSDLDDVSIILKQVQNNMLIEYNAELFDRKEHYSLCMDEVITKAMGFKISINQSQMFNEMDLQLCIRYKGTDIICRNISFGKFFPLSQKIKDSYLYKNGILLTQSERGLKLQKISDKNIINGFEKKVQEYIKNDQSVAEEDQNLRKIYHILKRIKRKELWLIGDRLNKADDNGEAFFTFMNAVGKNRNIETYFLLDKGSRDYERLRKIGKVVSPGTRKHKILVLLCDKIISAHADEFVINWFENQSYLYRDILHQQKFVFLQHGIIKDDLSRWLKRENKNISLFITATYPEKNSILNGAYYYDEKQIKCTGLPRYDYLYNDTEEKNVITFMPTWRNYLTGMYDIDKKSRPLKKGFENSTYCQMYRRIFSDSRLDEAGKKYQYKMKLMLHPAMPRECIEYFCCDKSIEILDLNTRYNKLFAESKLVITDYSSAVFDFAYLRKPVIYFQQDEKEIFSGKHIFDKGYFDYEKDGFGEVEYTTDDLVNRIIEYMENGCQLKEIYRDRIEKTFPYHDKENCKRVYEEIIKLE